MNEGLLNKTVNIATLDKAETSFVAAIQTLLRNRKNWVAWDYASSYARDGQFNLPSPEAKEAYESGKTLIMRRNDYGWERIMIYRATHDGLAGITLEQTDRRVVKISRNNIKYGYKVMPWGYYRAADPLLFDVLWEAMNKMHISESLLDKSVDIRAVPAEYEELYSGLEDLLTQRREGWKETMGWINKHSTIKGREIWKAVEGGKTILYHGWKPAGGAYIYIFQQFTGGMRKGACRVVHIELDGIKYSFHRYEDTVCPLKTLDPTEQYSINEPYLMELVWKLFEGVKESILDKDMKLNTLSLDDKRILSWVKTMTEDPEYDEPWTDLIFYAMGNHDRKSMISKSELKRVFDDGCCFVYYDDNSFKKVRFCRWMDKSLTTIQLDNQHGPVRIRVVSSKGAGYNGLPNVTYREINPFLFEELLKVAGGIKENLLSQNVQLTTFPKEEAEALNLTLDIIRTPGIAANFNNLSSRVAKNTKFLIMSSDWERAFRKGSTLVTSGFQGGARYIYFYRRTERGSVDMVNFTRSSPPWTNISSMTHTGPDVRDCFAAGYYWSASPEMFDVVWNESRRKYECEGDVTPASTMGVGNPVAPEGDSVGSGDLFQTKRKRKMKSLIKYIQESASPAKVNATMKELGIWSANLIVKEVLAQLNNSKDDIESEDKLLTYFRKFKDSIRSVGEANPSYEDYLHKDGTYVIFGRKSDHLRDHWPDGLTIYQLDGKNYNRYVSWFTHDRNYGGRLSFHVKLDSESSANSYTALEEKDYRNLGPVYWLPTEAFTALRDAFYSIRDHRRFIQVPDENGYLHYVAKKK